MRKLLILSALSILGCGTVGDAPTAATVKRGDKFDRSAKHGDKDSYCVAGKPCCFVNWGGVKMEDGKNTFIGYWDSTDNVVHDWADAKDCSAPPIKWCCIALNIFLRRKRRSA